MGNRMLCAASGILWAKAAGRSVYVDWRDEAYSRNRENSFHSFFAAPGVLRDAPADRDDTFPPVWRGHMDLSVSEMLHRFDPDKHSSLTVHKKYSIDPSRTNYTQPTVVFWYYMDRFRDMAKLVRARVEGYAGLSVGEISRKAIGEELPLVAPLRGRVDAFVEAHFTVPIVGVHVRHSDLAADLSKLESAVREQLASLPGAAVFLATDNRGVEEEYLKKFDRVITTPKWFPPEGAAMHQNKCCADPVANGEEALLDMHLLSRCDALVYAGRSTFGEIACLLSDAPRGQITDVDRRDPMVFTKRFIRRLTA
ncbi:MAG: hypothetical protein HND58_04230 [Planctomycetota bacterium]|nr:MAG: hypothetical protein HND58_04230 [Planctomycetota bacterium]